MPIGSMEWLTFVANVGKYTSPMDPMGRRNINNKLNDETFKSRMIYIFHIHQMLRGEKSMALDIQSYLLRFGI